MERILDGSNESGKKKNIPRIFFAVMSPYPFSYQKNGPNFYPDLGAFGFCFFPREKFDWRNLLLDGSSFKVEKKNSASFSCLYLPRGQATGPKLKSYPRPFGSEPEAKQKKKGKP